MELEAWDSAATLWADHVRGGGDLGWERHAAVLAEMLPPPDGLTVDAGCGEGRFTRDLRARGYDAVGFDATPALIDAARAADPAGIYEIADVRSLPLGDQSAKLVTCINDVRALATAGFTLDLREVPGRTESVPLYLDLSASRSRRKSRPSAGMI